MLAAQIAPALVFVLIGGVAADRFAPQRVIIAANLAMAIGEGTFGVLVLTGKPALWTMLLLEALTGTGMSLFYPASQALLPRLVSADLLQEASAISRLAMNSGQMAGAAAAGLLVAVKGPGWALLLCGIGMVFTVPPMLAIRGARGPVVTADRAEPGLLTQLREGWSEFRSHAWLWVTTVQYCVVMMAWYGSFTVLGPVVARAHLAAPPPGERSPRPNAVGLIAGGVLPCGSRRASRSGSWCSPAAPSRAPLTLALVLPLAAVCAASFMLGILVEVMMVQWTVALGRFIPQDKLARVSSTTPSAQ